MLDDRNENNLWNQQSNKSIASYDKFFKTIQKDSIYSPKQLLQTLTLETLHYHKAQILTDSQFLTNKLTKFNDIYLSVNKEIEKGLVYEYDLILGYFYLRLTMLNFGRNADQQNEEEIENIGSGGFGFVRMCNVQGKDVAVKRIKFKQKLQNYQENNNDAVNYQQSHVKYQQIRKAIREYAIYKVCSMLEIGPKIMFDGIFDLHCYNDCIEFYMQLCEVPFKSFNFFTQKDLEYQKLQNELKFALWKMHQIKLIHRDIKPENILYSLETGKFILTDFGLTHTVQASKSQLTLTGYSGTLKYSSPEMIEIYEQKKPGLVNLYHNDIYALSKVLDEFKEIYWSNKRQFNGQIQDHVKEISRNSMSFAESFSQHYSYRVNSEDYQSEDIQSVQENRSSRRDSVIRTGSSIPILNTNDTNSLNNPRKSSSEVNFYTASAIYFILKKHLVQNPTKRLKVQDVITIVNNGSIWIDTQKRIKQEVIYRLSMVFFPYILSNKNIETYNLQLLYRLQKQLSFRLRGYGPQMPQTIQLLQKINLIKKKQTCKFNNESFYLQVYENIQLNKTNLQERQLQMDTIFHKGHTQINKLKHLLNSINFNKLNQKEGNEKKQHLIEKFYNDDDGELFNTIALQYVKIMADGASVLMQHDLKEINDRMERFLEGYRQTYFNCNSNKKCQPFQNDFQQHKHHKSSMSKKDHLYSEIIINSLINQQQLIQNEIDQCQRYHLKPYFKQRQKTYYIIKQILSCIILGDDNDQKQKQRNKNKYFLIIKYIFYLSLKSYHQNQQQQKNNNIIFQVIENFTQQIVSQQQEKFISQSGEIKVISHQKVDEFIKNVYFWAKLNLQGIRNYQKTLDILQKVQLIKIKLKGNINESIYNEGFQFYQDFFIQMKLTVFIKLQQHKKGQQVGIKYLKSIIQQQHQQQQQQIFNNYQQEQSTIKSKINYIKLFNLLSKLFPTTMIQKLHILKKLADTKLYKYQQTSNQKDINNMDNNNKNNNNSYHLLLQAKQIYIECIKSIHSQYDWQQHQRLFIQLINNLIITFNYLNDCYSALEWCLYCFRLIKQQTRQSMNCDGYNNCDDGYNNNDNDDGYNNSEREKQLFHVTKNFIILMLHNRLIVGNRSSSGNLLLHNIKGEQQVQQQQQQQQQQLQKILYFNSYLTQIVNNYIQSKINITLKHTVFKKLQSYNSLSLSSSFSFSQTTTIDQNMFNIQIPFFNFGYNQSSNNNNNNIGNDDNNKNQQHPVNQQILILKQLFIKGYQQNMPYMQWNYKQLSLSLAKEYFINQNYKQSLKYLWNYVQQYVQNPHMLWRINNNNISMLFEHLILFIQLLVKQQLFIQLLVKQQLYQRAFKFIKKVIYYIPTNDFLNRKKLYTLWIKLYDLLLQQQQQQQQSSLLFNINSRNSRNSSRSSRNNSLLMQWVRQLSRNDFLLFKTRIFQQYFIQQQQQCSYQYYNSNGQIQQRNKMFQQLLCKKWIKKL